MTLRRRYFISRTVVVYLMQPSTKVIFDFKGGLSYLQLGYRTCDKVGRYGST